MNQQTIKRLLLLLVIGLGLCLCFMTLRTSQEKLTSGIISMQQIDITASVNGNIKNIYVKQGDTVKRGDILYEIDSQELTEKIAKAQQVIAKIEDDIRALSSPTTSTATNTNTSAEETVYQEAAAKAQKYQELYAQGAISRKMLSEAEAYRDMTYQALQAARTSGQTSTVYGAGNPTVLAMKQEELAHAQKNLQNLEEQSRHLIVTSPSDGIVSNQIYQIGQHIESGYLLANIAVKENCTLSAYISDEQKAKLTKGQEVSIVIGAYPDQNFSGIVETIGGEDNFAATPTSDDQTLVQIRMKNEKDLLRAGMQADIYIN
ncbi:MAG: efflux RND transporter periplasmic adaptor subunit [Selenomonadales bacterium]|nr:efflux RND transporter periplasmic adaptor subunit [Selenomonadales bacterium]